MLGLIFAVEEATENTLELLAREFGLDDHFGAVVGVL